jgi:phosphatidylserine/phosphatidylglycerophosphate/cardiolipin synthase-like enzyme
MTDGSAGAPPAAPFAPPAPFAWDDLAGYKAEGRFLDGYPNDRRTFFSPRDRIHALLLSLIQSAQHSLVLNMYGYADPALDAAIREKLASDHVYVQMSLDKTQAAGKSEKAILSSWENNGYANSIAIGTSSVKHAISHLKVLIVDGVYTITGSTNWSFSGEEQQDNQLTIDRNAVVAAEMRARLDAIHDYMLKQMAAKRKR